MKLLFICLLSCLVIVNGQYFGLPNYNNLNDGFRAFRIQIPRSSLGGMNPSFLNPNHLMSPEVNDESQNEDPQNPNFKKQDDVTQEQPGSSIFNLPINGMPGNIRIRIIDPSQLQNIPNLMNPEQNPRNPQENPRNPLSPKKAKKNQSTPKIEETNQPKNQNSPSNPVPIVLPDGRVAVVDSKLLNQLLSNPNPQPEMQPMQPMQPKSADVPPKKPTNKRPANPKANEEPVTENSPTENPDDQVDNTTPASSPEDKEEAQPRKANKPIQQVSSKSAPQSSPKKSKPALICKEPEDKE